MSNLSVCTTACVRPELLEQTYASFNRMLKGVRLSDLTLYINVDPAPSADSQKMEEIHSICKKYFANYVINVPVQPNFTTAVKWCWNNVPTKYVLHLEDDWMLNNPVDVSILLEQLDKNEHLYQAVLRAYKYHYESFVLSPSLLRASFFRQVSAAFDESQNPEIQLRKPGFERRKGGEAKHLIVVPDQPVLQDIGRAWIEHQSVGRPGVKSDFTKWI